MTLDLQKNALFTSEFHKWNTQCRIFSDLCLINILAFQGIYQLLLKRFPTHTHTEHRFYKFLNNSISNLVKHLLQKEGVFRSARPHFSTQSSETDQWTSTLCTYEVLWSQTYRSALQQRQRDTYPFTNLECPSSSVRKQYWENTTPLHLSENRRINFKTFLQGTCLNLLHAFHIKDVLCSVQFDQDFYILELQKLK